MRIRWRGPVLCASGEASGARDALRGLGAAGCALEVQQTPWARPVAAGAAELAWLAARQGRLPAADACVQRTLARHLDPHTAAVANVGWITVPGLRCDTETALRAAAMDLVAVATGRRRRALLDAGLAPERIIVLPEPVEVAAVRRAAPAAGPWGTTGPVVVAVTDGTRAGGWDLLVPAWAAAAGAGDEVALVVLLDAADPAADAAAAGERALAVLAGAGHDPDRLAELVIVPDPLDTAGLAPVLARACALVTPARRDGHREARAAALARVAGVPWIGPDGDGPDRAVPWTAVPDPGLAPGEDLAVREMDVAGLAEAIADALAGRIPAPDPRAGDRHDRDAVAAGLVAAVGRTGARPRRTAAGPPRPRMVLEGDLLGATSLAGVNRSLIAALVARGDIAVGALERDDRRVEPLDAGGPVAEAMRAAPGPGDVVVRHFHPPSFAAVEAGRLVQVVHWEFGALPREWRDGLAGCDEVWVASRSVRDAITGPDLPASRVRVLPLGVDHARFAGAAPMDLGDRAPGFRFLYVGGLAWRKGADLVLEAYARAFGRRDDVTLVVKDVGAGGRYAEDAIAGRLAAMTADPTGPRVLHLTGALPAATMPSLYAACDCLVHPYRAEAFGLTMLEAAAAGLPVVASGHGPVLEYLDTGCADLVPSRPVPYPGTHIGPYGLTAPPRIREPSLDDLVDALRRRADAADEGRDMGRRAARHVAGRTWDRAADVAAARVRALAGVDHGLGRAA